MILCIGFNTQVRACSGQTRCAALELAESSIGKRAEECGITADKWSDNND